VFRAPSGDHLTPSGRGHRLNYSAHLVETRAQSAAAPAPFDIYNPYDLTSTERQVVDLLMAGLTGSEVSDLLGISLRVVVQRRIGAMRKVGARNSLHLASMIAACRPGILPEGDFAVLDA
jgi:DNA-binding CsgD family transcriptional regulator